ncbi:LacI family DNA-binding transcriptional regulator [Paenibacillus medicaginis]|uniref:LacI family DNA-binding transcriptional regulator n=1 Tax=Paenibacillus medicaginis TaxID=1470560 RepID=A0ABV5C570_9BACL
MVSIKDIARKAGVSISTVSYALNGSDKVTPETCARILAIAKEMNYVPNAAARNLKKRETRIIGVFLTDFSGDVYGDLLYGIKEIMNRKGYDLIVCSGKQSHRMLPERMIDGAIVLDQTFSSEELLQYAERGHKIIVLDRELNHPNVNQVLLGNKAGGEQAAERVLSEFKGTTAVFCLNDEMAVGFYNRMAGTGLEIGRDIHVIGFDNIELAHYLQPRLSTIDYSKRKWGAVAAGQLLDILAGQPVENERIYVTLVKGDSIRLTRQA